MAPPLNAQGSGEKGDLVVQTVDRQSTSSSTPRPTKTKTPTPRGSGTGKHRRGSSGTHPRTPNSNGPVVPSDSASTSSEVEEELAATPMPAFRQQYAMSHRLSPFWRSPKGYCVIALAVVVIILAIVGAAVGGSIANKQAQKADEADAATRASTATTQSTDLPQPTSVQARELVRLMYTTTALSKQLPGQTENSSPPERTFAIRGRKLPGRYPMD